MGADSRALENKEETTILLNDIQNVLAVMAIVTASVLCLVVLNRIWPERKRSEHNNLIGWHLSLIGTTYAVILGFMLYTVWTDYGTADLNADGEANALSNLYRICDGMPEPQRSLMKTQSQKYAETVVHLDWPTKPAGKLPDDSGRVNSDMWRIVTSAKSTEPNEIRAEDQAIAELRILTEHRRMRLLQSASRLPGVLWWVLIAGAVITLGSACFFGSTNLRVHILQVASSSLLIALVLVAIAAIDRPFQGGVRVGSEAFQRASLSMQPGQ